MRKWGERDSSQTPGLSPIPSRGLARDLLLGSVLSGPLPSSKASLPPLTSALYLGLWLYLLIKVQPS